MTKIARFFSWASVLLLLMLLVVGAVTGCRSLTDATSTTAARATTTSLSEAGLSDTELSGLGDEYLPQAGNTGYDVEHYDIALDCDPIEGSLSGMTTVEAEALVTLDEFHLDLVGLEVEDVRVDGVATTYQRVGQELIIECPRTVETGSRFTVEVVYQGSPRSLLTAEGYPVGWQHSGDTIFTLDEPEGAATWYPLNDHPSDKATYSFRLTVPVPYMAVANGVLTDTETAGEYSTYVWEMDQPMANYLAAVVIGDLVLEQTASPAGVPIRNYFAPEVARTASDTFRDLGEALDFFSGVFGPYPFEVYGVVVPDADTSGSAMENQTLTLYGIDTVQEEMAGESAGDWYMSHELAHEWFGNSVTPASWQDIWLNEGFATYSSWLWLEHEFGADGMEAGIEYALRALSSEEPVLLGDPGIDALFSAVVYERGALVLHALRQTIGDDLFFSILRDWAADHAYQNVSTEDFIRLVEEAASEVDGFDARMFFDAWLYEEELPEWPEATVAD